MLHSYLVLGLTRALWAMTLFFLYLHAGGWRYAAPLAADSELYRAATTLTLVAIVFMQIANLIGRRYLSGSGLDAGLFANLAMQPFEPVAVAEWDLVMAVNVRGPFLCTQAVFAQMRSQQYGKVINIASGTVFTGAPMLLHYVSSKGAVVAMTRAMARELGDAGIRVNTLAPGLTTSENTLSNPAWQGAVSQNNIASRAIKRELTPEDLCGSLVYLASAESDFVTGQVIVVDGGSVMH